MNPVENSSCSDTAAQTAGPLLAHASLDLKRLLVASLNAASELFESKVKCRRQPEQHADGGLLLADFQQRDVRPVDIAVPRQVFL